MSDNEKIFSIKAIEEMLEAYRKLQSRNGELEGAIRWANGERDDFRERGPKEGAFWWRKELIERAGFVQEKKVT